MGVWDRPAENRQRQFWQNCVMETLPEPNYIGAKRKNSEERRAMSH